MTPTESYLKAIGDAVRPDAKVWVDEWAEANRILPPDTPEPGPFRNARTPYVIDVQRTMSPGSPYREGWWQKPVQIGGSVSGENLIGAWICTAAGSLLVVFPTLDDAKQWELTRFEPMRANTRELRRRIRPPDEKGSDNTKLRKKYPGGVMRLVGANRVGALKSATIRYVKLEEPDEYVTDLGDQGHPIDLARARMSNFGRKAKMYGDGTPTVSGRSAINKNFKRGDQRRWFLHCPDCRHPQHLQWSQMKWVDGDPATARYACSECGALNAEHTWKSANYAPRAPGMTETDAKAAGLAYWEATAVGEPGVASWHINALAAPIGWRPWAALVGEWIAAQGDEEKLKAFVNNQLGECWTDDVRSDLGAEQLQQRAEQYELMTCPLGGLICLAGVDTQDNRLAVVIRVFGRGEESWGTWHGEIYGNPSSPETWAKLRALLEAPIKHESGQVMRVDAAAIDAGGHHAEDVYAFCRDAQLRGKHWFAVRGAKSYDAPKIGRPKKIEFTWRGTAVPGGVELRWIGTQAIKNLIDGRLRLSKPGGGFYHFPLGFQADYFKQLRSEKREWRRDTQGHKALWWVKGTERNEAWDCEVYLYAAYLYAMSGQHAETVFRNREKLFGKVRQLELLDDGAPVQTPAQADDAEIVEPEAEEAEAIRAPVPARRPSPPKRRGFVNRWR
jgi:phage terminase large subunit GpA-like protein